MFIILGLGNPGRKYRSTRHNPGFRIVEEFLEKNNFPKFKLSRKFKAELSEGKIKDQVVILAKPRTFMNNSGKAAKLIIAGHQLPITNLFVIHDDIDLSLGKIKISKGQRSAGHKGVQSIIDELGTKNFIRFRIGIKPAAGNKEQEKSDFVLQKFNKDEEKILKEVIKKILKAIKFSLKENLEKAMQEFNKPNGKKSRCQENKNTL